MFVFYFYIDGHDLKGFILGAKPLHDFMSQLL